MALIKTSAMLSNISGKLNGSVFAHNRGGAYVRNRSIPVNPNTVRQQDVRNIFSQVSSAYKDNVTAAEIDGWKTWGQNSPVTNRLGDQVTLTPNSAFVKINSVRKTCGLAIITEAPTVFGSAIAIDPDVTGFSVSEATQLISISAATKLGNWDKDTDLDFAIISMGQPQNTSVTFFDGPYRIAGYIEGDSVSAPAFPYTITCPYTVLQGQQVFLKFRRLDPDSLVSVETSVSIVCGA